jgi:hypothetical protein
MATGSNDAPRRRRRATGAAMIAQAASFAPAAAPLPGAQAVAQAGSLCIRGRGDCHQRRWARR